MYYNVFKGGGERIKKMDIDISSDKDGLIFHLGGREVKENDISDSIYLNIIRVIIGLDVITNKKGSEDGI